MYQYIKSIALENVPGGRWITPDLSQTRLVDIFSAYKECHITLSNPFLDEEVVVDIMELRKTNPSNTQTLTEFLVSLGNAALVHTDKRITIKTTEVRYSDAFRSRFKVKIISPYVSTDVSTPREDCDWLAVTRKDTPMRDLHKYCMASVNGFFHLTDADDSALYVIDGGRTMRHSNRNALGLYNFEGIGSLQCIPISDNMVHQRWGDQPLHKQCYIQPDIDLSKKTVMLVFMGYLHVLDSATFYRVSDNTYCFDMENYPLLDRYYEASKILDLSSLGIEKFGTNGKKVPIAILKSEACIRAMMALSQSFLVAVDNPYMFVRREAIRRTLTLGNYVSFKKPTHPMILGTGRMAEYWTELEDGQWCMTVHEGFRDNLLAHTTNHQSSHVAPGDNRIPYNPMDMSPAFFLRLGSEVTY